jgi:hypothetical protein
MQLHEFGTSPAGRGSNPTAAKSRILQHLLMGARIFSTVSAVTNQGVLLATNETWSWAWELMVAYQSDQGNGSMTTSIITARVDFNSHDVLDHLHWARVGDAQPGLWPSVHSRPTCYAINPLTISEVAPNATRTDHPFTFAIRLCHSVWAPTSPKNDGH